MTISRELTIKKKMHWRLRYVNPSSNADTTTTTLGLVFVFSVLGLVAFILVMVTRSDIVEVDNRVDLQMSTLILDTRLNDTGVVPGIYIMPILTIDAKGRITSAIEQTPSNTSTVSSGPNVTSFYTVYINGGSGSDASDGLSPLTAKQTMQGALNTFIGIVAQQCDIVIYDYVDLGSNPRLTFFPATFGCDYIRVSGDVPTKVTDTVSGSSTTVDSSRRAWARVTGLTGGYTPGAYECNFIYSASKDMVYAVDNNTASTIDVLSAAVDFSSGDTFELYTVTTEIRWTGMFSVSTPQKIDFRNLIFQPQASASYHISHTEDLSTYTGCLFNAVPVSLPNYLVQGDNIYLSGSVVKAPTLTMRWCLSLTSSIVQASNLVSSGCTADFNYVKIIAGLTTMQTCVMSVRNTQFMSRFEATDLSNIWAVNVEVIDTSLRPFTLERNALFVATNLYVPSGVFFDIESGATLKATHGVLHITCNQIRIYAKGSMVLGGRIGNIFTFEATVISLSQGSYAYIDAINVNYNLGGSMFVVSGGSELHFESRSGWNTGTGSAATPLVLIAGGARVYGSGILGNVNFPGSELKCGNGPIGSGGGVQFDAATNCMCQ